MAPNPASNGRKAGLTSEVAPLAEKLTKDQGPTATLIRDDARDSLLRRTDRVLAANSLDTLQRPAFLRSAEPTPEMPSLKREPTYCQSF